MRRQPSSSELKESVTHRSTMNKLTVSTVDVGVRSETGDTGDGEGHAPVCDIVSIATNLLLGRYILLGSFLGGVPEPAWVELKRALVA